MTTVWSPSKQPKASAASTPLPQFYLFMFSFASTFVVHLPPLDCPVAPDSMIDSGVHTPKSTLFVNHFSLCKHPSVTPKRKSGTGSQLSASTSLTWVRCHPLTFAISPENNRCHALPEDAYTAHGAPMTLQLQRVCSCEKWEGKSNDPSEARLGLPLFL